MHAVITTVTLKPDSIDTVAKMFEESYIELVRVQEHFLSAKFTANRDTNIITVITLWTSADHYMEFRHTDRFRTTFARFMDYFAAPPIVTVNEVLYDTER
jgi:heme-degrading monooxygenase HmoA